MIIKSFLLEVFIFFTVSCFSQTYKYSNEFLAIGTGARELSMGGAVTSTCKGVFSTYWNPASLLKIKSDAQVGAMHNENFGGISKYDYLGFATIKKETSALGFSLIRNGVDGIPNTLNMIDENGDVRYDKITTFSVSDYAFFISAAQQLNDNGLSFGANVKIIRRLVGGFANSWGFGLDAALQYESFNWILSAMLHDATTTYNTWKFNTESFKEIFLATGNAIPENSTEITLPRLSLGISKLFNIGKNHSLLMEIDGDCTFDGKRNTLVSNKIVSIDPKSGLEYGFKRTVFFRAGVNNFQKIPDFNNKERLDIQPNIGAGFAYGKVTIDYALSIVGDKSNTLYSNIFSLTYSFNKK